MTGISGATFSSQAPRTSTTGAPERSRAALSAVTSSVADLPIQHRPPPVPARAGGGTSIGGPGCHSNSTTAVSSVSTEPVGQYHMHQTAGVHHRLQFAPPAAPSPLELQTSSAEHVGRGSAPPPSSSAGGSKPPTAKVTPFVGKSPVLKRGSYDRPATVGEKLGAGLTVSDRSIGTRDDGTYVTAVEGWGDEGDREGVKRVVTSLDAPSRSHDQHVTSGESLLDSSQRWKAVIESKDKLLAQKSQIIERYVCIHCTLPRPGYCQVDLS